MIRERISNNPLPVIIFTVFMDLVGFGILIPIIPLLLADPASPAYILSNNMSVANGYIILGFLVGTYSLMMFIATPILGQLSDIYGRKKLLAVSLAGTSVSFLIFAIGITLRSIPLLFISRALDGITGGNISVAQAAIADVTPPRQRARNFGLIGAAFGLGFILGPYIGGKLSDPHVLPWFSATTPFFFAAILSFINVMSVLFLFPETLKTRKQKTSITWTRALTNIRKAFTIKGMSVLFFTVFLFQSGFTFFTSFFGVFLIQRFGFTQGNIGDFFAYIGLWVALTQAFLIRWISSRWEEYSVLRWSLLGQGIAVLLYFFPRQSWMLFFIAPFFSTFNGLSQANIVALVSRSADPSIQGEVLGLNSSVQALGQAIPPILSGFIAASLAPQSPIIVSSAVILLSAAVFILVYRPSGHATGKDVKEA